MVMTVCNVIQEAGIERLFNFQSTFDTNNVEISMQLQITIYLSVTFWKWEIGPLFNFQWFYYKHVVDLTCTQTVLNNSTRSLFYYRTCMVYDHHSERFNYHKYAINGPGKHFTYQMSFLAFWLATWLVNLGVITTFMVTTFSLFPCYYRLLKYDYRHKIKLSQASTVDQTSYLIFKFVFNIKRNTVTNDFFIRLDIIHQNSTARNHGLGNVKIKPKFVYSSFRANIPTTCANNPIQSFFSYTRCHQISFAENLNEQMCEC